MSELRRLESMFEPSDVLIRYIEALVDCRLTTEEHADLGRILASDPMACDWFVDYTQLHASLTWDADSLGMGDMSGDFLGRTDSAAAFPAMPHQQRADGDCRTHASGTSSFPHTLVSTTPYDTAMAWLSSTPLPCVAYLLATMIVGIGLAIMAVVPVSRSMDVASQSPPAIERQQPVAPKKEVVGRITGMVDCKWGNADMLAVHGATVSLGEEYVLTSGLMEITYNTGAKVILQGPATYEVESKNGGFMSVGKLTGKVTTEAGRGLAIRTPTATVTDVGTEFGVETSRQSGTRVCVLQGNVSVRPSAGGSTREVLLKKGQSSQIDARGAVVEQSQDTKVEFEQLSKTFVRQLPQKQRAAFVSLTDLVAGGDGFGDRYHWGINPDDASVRLQIGYARKTKAASGAYNRYSGNRQIDGVFVPFGGNTPVQLDSAGHTFVLPQSQMQFDQTSLWAYKGQPWEFPPVQKPTAEKTAAMKSFLCLHASSGITFDLAAMRESAGGRNAVQFKSTVHNPQWDLHDQKKFKCSVWVFVDGQVKFSRRNLCRQDQPIDIDIPLRPTDRFLTLVGTDDGDGISFDHICFLEPRIFLETLRSSDDADGLQGGQKNAVRGSASSNKNQL